MSTLKVVRTEMAQATGELTTAASALTLVGAQGINSGAKLTATAIKEVGPTLMAVLNVFSNTLVGYTMEDKGISQEEARKIVDQLMPASVAEAIDSGAISLGKGIAIVAKALLDEEDNKDNGENGEKPRQKVNMA